MTLLVFSDSHGRVSKLLEAYAGQIKKPDAVIFLGDGLRDISYCDFDVPLLCVRGNCDVFSAFGGVSAEDELIMTLGGKKIMMTHGDRYSVKSTYTRICAEADRIGADIVLFGHTHIPFEKYLPEGECEYGIDLKKPLYMMNPGSIGDSSSSFGVVEIMGKGDVLLSHGSL